MGGRRGKERDGGWYVLGGWFNCAIKNEVLREITVLRDMPGVVLRLAQTALPHPVHAQTQLGGRHQDRPLPRQRPHQ